MKSKKNRKTIKHNHKIMNSIKYIKRRSNAKTIKNKKYMRGGMFIAKLGSIGAKAVGAVAKGVGSVKKGLAPKPGAGAVKPGAGKKKYFRQPAQGPSGQGPAQSKVAQGMGMFKGQSGQAPGQGQGMGMFKGQSGQAPGQGQGMGMFKGQSGQAPGQGQGMGMFKGQAPGQGQGMGMFKGQSGQAPGQGPGQAAQGQSKLLAQGMGMFKGLKGPSGQASGQAASGQAPGQGPNPDASGEDESPSATSSRKGSSLMKSAMSLKKFTPAGMMLGAMSSDKDIKYYFKKGMYALYKVMASLVTLPIRNLNEVIPPELCKQTTDNNFVCSQSLIQYVLTGSKQDYKKILLDSDKNECFEFEEDGNKIVKCKKPEAQLGGGSIVIGCNKNEPPPKFKKNDRVIVLDNTQNANAAYVELNNEKWFIGTVTRVTDKYKIQIDNGGELERDLASKDINKYNNDWNDFYKEFYNMPKVVLKDMYDMGYEIGHPVIERINKIMKIIYKKSGIYKIVKIFVFLSRNIWQCYSMLLKMDEKNVLVVAIKKLVETYKEKKYGVNRLLGTNKVFGEKNLNMFVTFNCMLMIYDKVNDGITVEKILAELDDSISRIQVAVGKKLKLMQEKLIKFNLYLRKYECPMNKLESMIHNINNAKLLEKMLEALDTLLLGDNNYEEINGIDEKENRKKRIELCDLKYNYKKKYNTSITPDSTYMDFDIDPEKEQPKCKSCSNTWAEVVVRYGCFFSKVLDGNKNNMTYILMNIVQDMATINGSDDPIIENIRDILKNIECRTDLRKVISKRIDELNPLKKTKSIEDEANENNELTHQK